MKQQNEKQRMNKSSTLLSQDENDLVFSLLGRRCQAMSTAVVQLFTTEAPAHSAWVKRLSGIACFVRDSSKRSYFIRVYCLNKHELVWEEEMYDSINVNKQRDFLITFEGQDCMVALSFASDAEANNFHKTVYATITNRQKKRRSRKFSPTKTDGTQDAGYDSGVVLRNPNATTGMSQFSQMTQPTGIRDKKRPAGRKLTKADISQPTNFKHLAHVGWNDSKRFELNSEEVNSLDTFLKKAGVSEQQLNDRDTRAYIYDFIQSHNVLDSVISEKQGQAPPPVPTRNNPTQRIAPPPPPSANITKPPAQLPKPSRGGPPGRPPPITEPHIQQTATSTTVHIPAPPPPPPPPPPPLNTLPSLANQAPIPSAATPAAPPQPDVRSALMDSIRKGTTLKKVDPAAPSTGSGDVRNELLSEIREGVQLKPAAERELSGQRDSCNRGTDALADALRRALEERKRAIHSSDDEEESTSDNEEWDD